MYFMKFILYLCVVILNQNIMKSNKWIIDPTQSEISFKIRKLMVTTVQGKFNIFEGEMETDPEQSNFLRNIKFKAEVDSIETDDKKRDAHLKSADFFDTQTYPYLHFTAKSLNKKDTKIYGEFNIHNITKPVVFDIELISTSSNDNGENIIALNISGKVNRKDFDLSWNGKNEAGDIIVGDEIELKAQVQFLEKYTAGKLNSEAEI